jgi:hypothetical protein
MTEETTTTALAPGPPARTATPAPPAGSVLEAKRRLSESIVWKLQRAFYAQSGPAAWKPKGVPFFITSNTFIAKAYARVVLGLLRDLSASGALDRDAPLYVVELASGSGQFAFLFLTRLLALIEAVPALAGLRVRYVMTDFAEKNVEAWPKHERFQPFLEQGQLDFARFDLERDVEIRLRRTGEVLSAAALRNPLVVVANYTFDTTVQDAFWMRQGVLHEGLVTTTSSRVETDLEDPEILGRVTLRYEPSPIGEGYYDDARLNRVLETYRTRLSDTSFLVPVGALRCLRTLMGLSPNGLALLCGDKAFSQEDELIGRGDPGLALHGGSFSMMVNLHAMGLYVQEAGGTVLHGAQRDARLKVSAFLVGLPAPSLSETRLAFQDAVSAFGPADYHHLAQTLRKDQPAPPLEVVLALLRLSDWDFELVVGYREAFLKHGKTAPEALRQELRAALSRSWESFYPLQRDVAFDFARVCLALKYPQDVVRYGRESLRLYGDHHLTFTTLGLAHVLLEQLPEGLECARRALALKPDSAAARELKIRLEGILGAAGEARPPTTG